MSRLSLASPLPKARSRNQLLAFLPDDEFHSLRQHLKTVPLTPRQVLYQQGERIRYVYFPNGGVVSMAAVLPEGTMVEAATVGCEGIVGSEAFFDDEPVSICEAIVQVPAVVQTAERMTVDAFRRELHARRTLHRAVARYAEALHTITVRLMACNSHHQVEERCARWLLTMHDRMGGRDFHLSHEFLAAMLGVRRQSVTIVAGALRTAGLIRYAHGHVSVLDRRGLEAAACECYPVIRALYKRAEF